MSKLMRADPSSLNGLCNKGIDIIKFSITQLNVNPSQDIDSVCYRIPVKRHIVRNVQIQIPVQRFNRLSRASGKICRINLIISTLIISIQIRITEYRNNLDLSGILVNIADHNYI